MAKRALRPCRETGCYALTRDAKGYCDTHKRDAWGHTTTPTQRGYGHTWRKLRAAVLERDLYQCLPCLAAGRLSRASQVDHITPKAQGGTDALGNLQAICEPCHRVKTARE